MGSQANVEQPDLVTDLAQEARKSAVARRLKAARSLAGMKVKEAADSLGWSQEKLYRLERGDRLPDALELEDLATLYGQPLEFFLGPTSPGASEVPGVLPHAVHAGQAADGGA